MMKTKLMLAVILVVFSVVTASAQVAWSDAQGAIKRGNEKFARGQYEEAIKEYRRTTQTAGTVYAQSLYNIGVCYFELGRNEDAIGMYRRAVEARGGHYPKASYALGVALEIAGRLDEAGEAYKRAVTESEGKYTEAGLAVAHYRLALIAGRSGAYEKAAALFRETVARSKEQFPAVHNNLGVMLALSGQVAEAEREFELALRQAPKGFEEAAHNLELCRLLLTEKTRDTFASLKVADSTFILKRD
jgi:tetratricopeptide (TPR) repeat protein